MQKVFIVDLKADRKKDNGVLYCRAIDAETGETLIMADIAYVMAAVKAQNYEIVDAQDVLARIATYFKFFNK